MTILAFFDDDPSRATRFVAAPNTEMVNGAYLLIAAYAFLWAAIFYVVFVTFRRQQSLERQVHALEKQLRSIAQKQGDENSKP
jgi:CcmD family protein